jgi:hypothetical protein
MYIIITIYFYYELYNVVKVCLLLTIGTLCVIVSLIYNVYHIIDTIS